MKHEVLSVVAEAQCDVMFYFVECLPESSAHRMHSNDWFLVTKL